MIAFNKAIQEDEPSHRNTRYSAQSVKLQAGTEIPARRCILKVSRHELERYIY